MHSELIARLEAKLAVAREALDYADAVVQACMAGGVPNERARARIAQALKEIEQ